MFVGEAPGANEDEQGLPFVGQAGKLLDKLLGEIGLEREDVFIANVLKCRPPGNRDPQPARDRGLPATTCSRQVELIEPRVICTLGNFATKLLRGDPTGITRLHGQAEVRVDRPPRRAALPALPPGRGALHAVDARDAARRLRAAARAAGAGPAAAAGALEEPVPEIESPSVPAGCRRPVRHRRRPARRLGAAASADQLGALLRLRRSATRRASEPQRHDRRAACTAQHDRGEAVAGSTGATVSSSTGSATRDRAERQQEAPCAAAPAGTGSPGRSARAA